MAGSTLNELESTERNANQAFYDSYQAKTAADENAAAANEAYQQALNNLCNDYDGRNPADKQSEFQEAKEALDNAKAEAESANESFEAAAEAAQEAADAVEAKKEELRKSRFKDTSYVVHTARIECSCGMRDSYLVLDRTHGVYTRQIPQMTVKDNILDTNIINFGGCKSKENPSLIEAAEKAVADARKLIEEGKDWRDHLMGIFVKEEEIEVTDSLLEQCVGECQMKLPKKSTWSKGHKKVKINRRAPLLRRCELTCNYGGKIIILLSGQPE